MRIFGHEIPPGRLLTAAAVWVGGSLLGVGLFTFGYGQGFSYLTNDPASCNNCHIMNDWYDGWQRGSHANVATCQDCHMPHDVSIVEKYTVKGILGFRHGLAFTTGWHPENLEASEMSVNLIEDACVYCHGGLVSEISRGHESVQEISCIRCHENVGHDR